MRNLTFVIVDDALFIRTVLRKMIEEVEGYAVVGEGSNGYDAIEQVKRYKPDIITLDITMPEMNGVQAIADIMRESPETRIIMISAMGQQGMVMDAIIQGARDFVVKPFEKSRVLQAIRNVAASR
jgi:two-component system, chemotaxis family, chemotaxis protein CheY